MTLDIDWCEPQLFMSMIAETVSYANTDIAVIWTHHNGNESSDLLIASLLQKPCLVVQVLGSQSISQSDVEKGYKSTGCAKLITVTLGVVRDDSGCQRWLTWDEISVLSILLKLEKVGWLVRSQL